MTPLEPALAPTEDDLVGVMELNRLRAAGDSGHRRRELEARFERAFAAHHRLAVYGSLAPGRENHHQLAALAGIWEGGFSVTGERLRRGWGASLGYLALRWDRLGPPVAVQRFVSPALPDHWARLDAFEGDEYLRIVAPLWRAGRAAELANVYAARETFEERE